MAKAEIAVLAMSRTRLHEIRRRIKDYFDSFHPQDKR